MALLWSGGTVKAAAFLWGSGLCGKGVGEKGARCAGFAGVRVSQVCGFRRCGAFPGVRVSQVSS